MTLPKSSIVPDAQLAQGELRTARQQNGRLPRHFAEEIKAAEFKAAERERERLSMELHDGLGQHLTGIAFLAKALANRLNAIGQPEARDADQIAALVNQAVGETRALARGLQPVGPEDNALSVALAQLAHDVSKHNGVECIYAAHDPVPVANRSIANHLYRIAQEAVHNAVKHGERGIIRIDLTQNVRTVTMAISNKGHLAEEGERRSGMGMSTMRYRARVMDARLTLQNIDKGVEKGEVRLRVTLKRQIAQMPDHTGDY